MKTRVLLVLALVLVLAGIAHLFRYQVTASTGDNFLKFDRWTGRTEYWSDSGRRWLPEQ